MRTSVMSDPFTRAVARAVVTQICQNVTPNYATVQRYAADALADILLRYISEIGAGSHAYAELAGRSECNINDVFLSLEDTGAHLDKLMELMETEEDPFTRPLPTFPMRKRIKDALPTFKMRNEQPPNEAIPDWLPALPDKHTYIATPTYAERKADSKQEKLQLGKERRRAEKSLVGLQRRTLKDAAGDPAQALRERWPAAAQPSDEEQKAVLAGEGLATSKKRKSAMAAVAANPFLAPSRIGPPSTTLALTDHPTETATPGGVEKKAGVVLPPSVADTFALPLKKDSEEGGRSRTLGGLVLGAKGGQESLPVPEVGKRSPVLFSLGWTSQTQAKGRAAQSRLPPPKAKPAAEANGKRPNVGSEEDEKRKKAEAILLKFEKEERLKRERDAQAANGDVEANNKGLETSPLREQL